MDIVPRIIGIWECRIDMRDIARRILCSETNVRKWIKQKARGGKRREGLKDNGNTIVDRD